MSLVAVQIVTFNSAATIERCLHSVAQQQDVSCRLHVLDNASQDDTVQRIEAMGIKPLISATNIGYAAAHNLLLGHDDSEFVLTLNPDAYLEADFLAHLAAALQRDEALGSAAGCLLRWDEQAGAQRIDSLGLFMRRNRRQGLRAHEQPLSARPTVPIPIFGPDGAAAFYRRRMLQDISLDGEIFDADFFLHKEDVDVCWRAQLRGWQSICVPDAIGYHVRSFRPDQRQRVTPEVRCYGVRNRYLLLMKNDDLASMWRSALAILGYDLAILAYLLLFERSSLAALRSAWGLRRRMLAKRRIIQQRRLVAPPAMRRWFEA